MPFHPMMVDPFVIWKMDTVLTVPLTQLESNVKDASQATLVILQETQHVLVGKHHVYILSWIVTMYFG